MNQIFQLYFHFSRSILNMIKATQRFGCVMNDLSIDIVLGWIIVVKYSNNIITRYSYSNPSHLTSSFTETSLKSQRMNLWVPDDDLFVCLPLPTFLNEGTKTIIINTRVSLWRRLCLHNNKKRSRRHSNSW